MTNKPRDEADSVWLSICPEGRVFEGTVVHRNRRDWHDGNICSAGPPITARWTGSPLEESGCCRVCLTVAIPSVFVKADSHQKVVVLLRITFGNSEISTHKHPFSQKKHMMSVTELAYPPASDTLFLLEWKNKIPSLRPLVFWNRLL